jgi:NitT/TauT family transport system ATP-binding protein
MAPRPGRIRKCIDIDLDYPRNRLSNDFVSYRREILEMLDFGKTED